MLKTIDLTSEEHRHGHGQNRFAVIPTAEKLRADGRLAGRGVTVAFLDAGFYPHPDFAPRVVAFHDVAGEEAEFHTIARPRAHHWHGTQTVAACAGSGALADGVYRGLAAECRLVLCKVSAGGRVSDATIERGLRWMLANRERYSIRVLNVSLGGDADARAVDSPLDRLVEELVRQGVFVTVAAGNSDAHRSIPPASAPSVLTVGGFSDENQFAPGDFELYHSNFGATIDGLVKPELIAPAMHVAAPILPGTPDYDAAETLSMLAAAPDYALGALLEEYWEKAGLPASIGFHGRASARARIEDELAARRIVATHYKAVDGTSFAAPIAASVAAQMLEANPALTPAAVKNILIATAVRLAQRPTARQGYGLLNAPAAVAEAARETHSLAPESYGPPRVSAGRLVFAYHDDAAQTVALAGDFNDWRPAAAPLARCADGLWRAALECPPRGRYAYKFLVDGRLWREDPSHGRKEDDRLGGFHSILEIN